MDAKEYKIHLLRAGIAGFVAGCRVTDIGVLRFGELVKTRSDDATQAYAYGLIYDIHIDDDGLVQQLAIANTIDKNVINDNRVNRNVPLEMSVIAVGYQKNGQIKHLLPPRPPLSLDVIEKCSDKELSDFTTATERFGYFRHILRAKELPIGELLAAHIEQAHNANTLNGNPDWINKATKELITLLRDDYHTLMSVLSALGDVIESQGGA